MKKLLCLLLVLCMLPLAGCSGEPKFSTQYEIVSVDPAQKTVRIAVTVTNEGNSQKYMGEITDYFERATLTASDGKAYQYRPAVFSPDATKRTMRRGEQVKWSFLFKDVEADGLYNLSFEFMDTILEISNISISFTE